MVLRAGYLVVAQKLQEAATAMSHADIQSRLSDCLNDTFRGTGSWAYLVNVFGDDSSGDVVYSSNSDLMRAPYTVSASSCSIDVAKAVEVLPLTTYEPKTNGLTESGARNSGRDLKQLQSIHDAAKSLGAACAAKEAAPGSTATGLAVRESAYRDAFCKAMSLEEALNSLDGELVTPEVRRRSTEIFESSRVGESRSESLGLVFAECISPAISRLSGLSASTHYGTGGSRGTNGARGSGNRESDPSVGSGNGGVSREVPRKHLTLALVESAACLEVISLRESKADYEIKLIAPGKGSTAFYPSEVLKRDGPGVFKAGTHVYLNHPTLAEEAARPEGDVKNLAGVLTTPAVYHESHAKGEGLYARMKVFADHGQIVEEKAAHVGMSIRASGIAEADGKKRDGVPILKQLTSAESVDVVTRAGAGGLILTESAAPPNEESMTLEETKQLIEAAVAESVKPFQDRAHREDVQREARAEATRLLETVRWPDSAKSKVIERCCESVPEKDGKFDVEAFRTIVVAESKSWASVFAEMSGSGRVQGMGAADPFAIGLTEAQRTEIAAQEARDEQSAKNLRERGVNVFTRLTGSKSVAEAAMGKVA